MLSPDCNAVKIDMQDGIPTMWILVDTEDLTQETEFRIYGTGQELTHDIDGFFFHAGSFFQGTFVWHVFQQH